MAARINQLEIMAINWRRGTGIGGGSSTSQRVSEQRNGGAGIKRRETSGENENGEAAGSMAAKCDNGA